MLKLNQQSSFKADLKLAKEEVIIIQSIPGVLYHSAKNLGFQGNADPQVWHSPEVASEVSKVLGQVWSESTRSMLIHGLTHPHFTERGLQTSCLMPARGGEGSVWRPWL